MQCGSLCAVCSINSATDFPVERVAFLETAIDPLLSNDLKKAYSEYNPSMSIDTIITIVLFNNQIIKQFNHKLLSPQ